MCPRTALVRDARTGFWGQRSIKSHHEANPLSLPVGPFPISQARCSIHLVNTGSLVHVQVRMEFSMVQKCPDARDGIWLSYKMSMYMRPVT